MKNRFEHIARRTQRYWYIEYCEGQSSGISFIP
jgi:hypothetical protein